MEHATPTRSHGNREQHQIQKKKQEKAWKEVLQTVVKEKRGKDLLTTRHQITDCMLWECKKNVMLITMLMSQFHMWQRERRRRRRASLALHPPIPFSGRRKTKMAQLR